MCVFRDCAFRTPHFSDHPPQELQPFEADLQPVEATAVRAAAANIMAKRNLRIGNPSLDGDSARFERIRGFPSSGEVQYPSGSAEGNADRFRCGDASNFGRTSGRVAASDYAETPVKMRRMASG